MIKNITEISCFYCVINILLYTGKLKIKNCSITLGFSVNWQFS